MVISDISQQSGSNEQSSEQSLEQSSEPVYASTLAISSAGYAAEHESKLKSKTRRGYGRKNRKHKCENKLELSLVGTNSAGLNTKRESFFHLVNTVKPSLITLQETKVSARGTIKLPGYQCFEHIRANKGGGGLLTAALHDLNPTLITEH